MKQEEKHVIFKPVSGDTSSFSMVSQYLLPGISRSKSPFRDGHSNLFITSVFTVSACFLLAPSILGTVESVRILKMDIAFTRENVL